MYFDIERVCRKFLPSSLMGKLSILNAVVCRLLLVISFWPNSGVNLFLYVLFTTNWHILEP